MSVLVAFLLLWGEASQAWVPWGRRVGRGRNAGFIRHISTGISLSPASEAAIGESGWAWDGGHMADLGWWVPLSWCPALTPAPTQQ